MVQQTIQFESVSLSEIGSGTITAFLFSGTTLAATLASITENATLKGRFTGTVDDVAAAQYRLVVKFDGYTVSEPDYLVTLLLAVGTYTAERLAELDSASISAIRDGIPKVGETHRYTQVDSGATTTDVSIGEAT